MSESGAGNAGPDDDHVSLVGGGFGSAFSLSGAFHAIIPDIHRSTGLLLVLQKQTAEDDQTQQGGEDPPKDSLIHHFRLKWDQLGRHQTEVAGRLSLPPSYFSHQASLSSRFSRRGECVLYYKLKV